jgi:hypothetical protein
VTDCEVPTSEDDEFQERAAIYEFDGGYSRAEAERLAREEIGKAQSCH